MGKVANVTKDLLYNQDNKNLDIARFSAFISVLAYIGYTGYALVAGLWIFDPTQWGIGWASLCGGNAAWIFARQRYEARIAFAPTEKRADAQYDIFQPRMNDDVL